MSRVLDADDAWRQHRAHRPGIDPAVGVAADRRVDRAMVHAGAAADAAQHLAELPAEHRAAAVVEDNDVILLRPVRIVFAARPGRERGVDRHFLRGRRAREHTQELRHVFQCRHHLLDRGEHDMHARERLRQVAVALVGDDDRRAGLGDEEIRAGDADVGGEKAVAQNGARLAEQRLVLLEIAVLRQMRVHAAEVRLDLFLGKVHRRHDDVRRQLVADLHQIFAEVGLDRRDTVLLEEIVDRDFLADHRLALGDELRIRLAADVEHDCARLLGRHGVMHMAAGGGAALLEALEIKIEMRQRMVLDVARAIAQRLEFGELAHHQTSAVHDPGLDAVQRRLQLRIGQRLLRVLLERRRGEMRCDAHRSPIAG